MNDRLPPQTLEFPDAIPRLSGDSVYLRELTEDDVPGWFERASDPASSALSGDPVPDSADTCLQWLELHRERFRQRTGIRWAIVPAGSTESVGSIGLTIASEEDGIAELGAVVARAYWNKGIGTSAAKLVVRYAFDVLGLTEVRADFVRSNLASKRVLEKVGFRFEQDIREYLHSATGFQDGYLYVLRNQNSSAAPQRR